MGAAMLSYADDELIRSATVSMTNANASYPASNVKDDDPALPAKATATATTFTIALAGPAPSTPDAFAIINHNLAGATVTLGTPSGFSQVITIPARTRSGLCVNALLDMRALSNRTSVDWTLTITGASAFVAIGRLVLVTTLRTLGLRPGLSVNPQRLAADPLRTFYGSEFRYDKAIRMREVAGELVSDTDRVTIETAHDAAKGSVLPFLFTPDIAVNDAWWVQFQSLTYTRQAPNVSPARCTAREVSMGLVL
jgi:hypothetical protein